MTAELKIVVSGGAREGIALGVLNQIKDQVQDRFSKPLRVGFYEIKPNPDSTSIHTSPSFYYLAEVATASGRFLGIFSRKEKILVHVAIDEPFYGAAFGKRVVRGFVRMRSMGFALEIAKKHLQEYADQVQATELELTQG